MDNPNAHLTQGPGPFRPPSNDELTAANTRVAELGAQVARLQSILNVHDSDGLNDLVNTVVNVEGIDVEVDSGDEQIVITIDGATISDDGEIVGPEQEFEVAYHVELEGVLTVRARNEAEADDAVVDALDNFRWELDALEIDEDEHIIDQHTGGAEVSHRFRG